MVAPGSPPRLDAADSYSLQVCVPPANLPVGEMTQRDIERFWSRDRMSLADCAARHKALVDYYTQRDAYLRGDA